MAQQSSAMRAGPSAYSLIEEPENKVDTNPSDYQPPGVDEKPEDKEYESLEEALTGG